VLTNVGVIDGVFRFTLGVGLLALSYGRFGVHLPAELAWIAWTIGAYLGATGLFRYCPVYALLGTNSCVIYPMQGRQPPATSALDKGEPSP
jgi:hypothetical protein